MPSKSRALNSSRKMEEGPAFVFGSQVAGLDRNRLGLRVLDPMVPTFRQMTVPRFSSVISCALKPNSLSTSSVCSPNSGGRAAMVLGVRDSVTG